MRQQTIDNRTEMPLQILPITKPGISITLTPSHNPTAKKPLPVLRRQAQKPTITQRHQIQISRDTAIHLQRADTLTIIAILDPSHRARYISRRQKTAKATPDRHFDLRPHTMEKGRGHSHSRPASNHQHSGCNNAEKERPHEHPLHTFQTQNDAKTPQNI